MSINSHISNWIDRSEIKEDFYMSFIKSWIPYNAWYMHNYYDDSSIPKRTSDSAIILYINSISNRYRDKIKSLLRGQDNSSIEFKKMLANLHFELENHPIPNDENRVSFTNVNLTKNITKVHFQHSGRYTFFVEFKDQIPKNQKRWFLEVQKKINNQTLHRIELFDWSLEELNNNSDFINLPEPSFKSQLRDSFNHINPKKPIILIVPPKRTRSNTFTQPQNSIEIDNERNLYFVYDIELISQAIVQLLYELRCKLFHGELDPTDSNQGIYKYAYEIQKTLIKELK